MKINYKSAQAALEFLITYGWAFLVILVMVGALFHFGVLDPQNLLPTTCISADGFYCHESIASSVYDVILLSLKNGPRPVIINEKNITGAVTGLTDDCENPEFTVNDSAKPSGELVVQPNEIFEIIIIGCDIADKEQAKVEFDLAYRPLNGKLELKSPVVMDVKGSSLSKSVNSVTGSISSSYRSPFGSSADPNGVCGSLNGQTLDDFESQMVLPGTLCEAGYLNNYYSYSGNYGWSCQGNSTTSWCNAYESLGTDAPTCGSVHGSTFDYAYELQEDVEYYSGTLCDVGVVLSQSFDGWNAPYTYQWDCLSDTGSESCLANINYDDITSYYSASCGTANGATYNSLEELIESHDESDTDFYCSAGIYPGSYIYENTVEWYCDAEDNSIYEVCSLTLVEAP